MNRPLSSLGVLSNLVSGGFPASRENNIILQTTRVNITATRVHLSRLIGFNSSCGILKPWVKHPCSKQGLSVGLSFVPNSANSWYWLSARLNIIGASGCVTQILHASSQKHVLYVLITSCSLSKRCQKSNFNEIIQNNLAHTLTVYISLNDCHC